MAAPAARQDAYDFGDIDVPIGGRGTQPRGLDDGGPEAVAVVDGDIARRDADPDRERKSLVARVEIDCPLHRNRGRDGFRGSREHHEHAVAETLHDGAAVGLRGLDQGPIVLSPHRLRAVLAQRLSERGRTDEIGHQNGRSLCRQRQSSPLTTEPEGYSRAINAIASFSRSMNGSPDTSTIASLIVPPTNANGLDPG